MFLSKYYFAVHLKHCSSYPSANVKPMSNELVHCHGSEWKKENVVLARSTTGMALPHNGPKRSA
jgi:hypothetical protein